MLLRSGTTFLVLAVAKKIASELGVPLLGCVPLEMSVRQGGDQGIPIVVQYAESESAQALKSHCPTGGGKSLNYGPGFVMVMNVALQKRWRLFVNVWQGMDWLLLLLPVALVIFGALVINSTPTKH